MRKIYSWLLLAILFYIPTVIKAQCPNINHWEAAVLETNLWKYTIPTSQIANWNQPNFNDAMWLSGTGGIGYADGDDNTLITSTSNILYMRRSFNVTNLSAIDWAVLCMDYDDGFIAYLNGVEIARANITPGSAWNAAPNAQHEARLYQGYQPAYFTIPQAQLQSLLQNGTNVLAIETRNLNGGQADLSSKPYLMLGLNNSTVSYQPVPFWFHAPLAFGTKLPLMMIQTLGQDILDDPRITCDMGIIYHGVGNTNCVSDSFNHYKGKINIEFRGSSSQGFPKKPYGFSTLDAQGNNLNVSLLGMPEEHDWVLLNPYTDKTFMRDLMSYDLGRALGWYASRAQFIELFIDGDYQGVYVLLEKIKRDDNRVDVAKLDNTMNSGDAVTGGYIFKIDKTTGNSNNGWYTLNYGVSIQNHEPNWNEITPSQQSYLQNYINTFENTLVSSSFTNATTGYRKYANVFSFADLFILNEVSNNVDGYRLSTYIHKDRDSRCGRFTMGPIWDYNLTYGNANYCNGYPTYGWQMYQGCGDGSSNWINRMLQDAWFKDMLSCRYAELRQTVLSNASLTARVDSYRNYLLEAHVRDSALWQTIGNYIWPNAWIANSWQGEIDSMKQWITARMQWMDANMYSSTSPCNTSTGMNVVIDEINYHSDSTLDAGDWIELYNAGSSAANLSNAILLDGNHREHYCVLPANYSLAAGQRVVVYADSLKFATKFPSVSNKIGPLCFHLSDSSQQILLLNQNNRKIYSLQYADTWQRTTDGHGRTLQLVSSSANPNLATSWFASCMGGSPGVAYTPCIENLIYSEINYNSATTQDAGDWIELHNKTTTTISLSGWKLRDENNALTYTLPSGFSIAPNAYLVIYSDATKFNSQFPTVFNKIGPSGVGLSSGSDVIRLFDNMGILKYSVSYQSLSPWPSTPNGGGYTLENGQYNGNANEAASWFAGCPEGSPGSAYNPICSGVGVQSINNPENKLSVYPNPANTTLYLAGIQFAEEAYVYDIQGKRSRVQIVQQKLDLKNLTPGIYTLKVLENQTWYIARFVKE